MEQRLLVNVDLGPGACDEIRERSGNPFHGRKAVDDSQLHVFVERTAIHAALSDFAIVGFNAGGFPWVEYFKSRLP